MPQQEISFDAPQIMTREARMTECLTRAMSPQALEVKDESHKHHGHGGWREEGETHYAVYIVAQIFKDMNRVERHRMINTLLASEFDSGLHALALTALSPEEAARRAK